MEFQQLWEMQQAGMPIPPEILLKNAPLQNKEELMQAVDAQQKQAQEMQQMQQQIQMAEIQSRINLANARAEADRGLGIERASRVGENIELANERSAKAEDDRIDALLNQIKAAKEIQAMDLDALIQGLQIADQLKAKSKAEEETQKPQTGLKQGVPGV